MSAWAKFLRVWALCTLLPLMGVGVLNWWVDPLLVFGNNQLGVYASVERQFKARTIKTYPHNALIIGTSKIALINPDKLIGFTFFNASFSSALPEEVMRFLGQNLQEQELVLVGLDFFTFNEHSYPFVESEQLYNDSFFANILSLEVLKESLETITYAFLGTPQYVLRNGQRNMAARNGVEPAEEAETYDGRLEKIHKKYYSDFVYSERRIEALIEMKAILERKGIVYKIFLNPINEKEYQRMLLSPSAYTAYLRLSRDLKRVFPSFIDLATGKYSQAALYYPDDPIHFRPEVGKELVNEVLSDLIEKRDAWTHDNKTT